MMRGAILLLSFAISFLSWPAGVGAHDHDHMMKAAEPLSGTSIYNLTSSWTDQDGNRVKLQALRGGPVVVSMGYTRCKDICPMIVADMVAIEDRAKEAGLTGIRFAFFSLDSANDTPERLTAYARDHGLEPAHWTLYQGDDKAVRELAAALGVRYRRDATRGFDHSAIITILDADGTIVVQQPDAQVDTEEMVKKITALFTPAAR
jgi:protein SCO1/2